MTTTPLSSAPGAAFSELIVCSLEQWDDVWRRNQFLSKELLDRNANLRLLFVEPPANPYADVMSTRRPRLPKVSTLRSNRRITRLRPVKIVPRRLGAGEFDLELQVRFVARALRFRSPILWVNDVAYSSLPRRTGWPTLYDVTDDWLLAPGATREVERLRRGDAQLLRDAAEVVVCSSALATSRGRGRVVHLIPNGVDVSHFQRPQPRPSEMPAGPVAVYVGTLHDARVDVSLLVDLARQIPALSIMLVGPDSFSRHARAQLAACDNVTLIGPRPYSTVPGYLQHADVVVVPHVVSPFTETLDPIKAYECLAIDTPVVATPVAGFRELSSAFDVADKSNFIPTVASSLTRPRVDCGRDAARHTWGQRGREFERVLNSVAGRRPDRSWLVSGAD